MKAPPGFVMNKRWIVLFALLIVMAAAAAGRALASSGGNYVLDWFTISGGGGDSAGSMYTLSGTSGQIVIGQPSGDDYTLSSGFWSRPAAVVIPMQVPSSNGVLYRFPPVIQAGSGASGPNQWYAKVVPGIQGEPGDPFHFVVWLHLPEDWTLPWARSYSFTGDFSSVVLDRDSAGQAWIEGGGNCPVVGGSASAGYKWRAFIGPEESLPADGGRLDNFLNLRGGLGVPSGETPAIYGEFVMAVGVYYDSDGDNVPESYDCSGGIVPPITVE